MNYVLQVVLSHPLTWGQVNFYLENMYVMDCISSAIQTREISFCFCSLFMDCLWCVLHSGLILNNKSVCVFFPTTFVERFLVWESILFLIIFFKTSYWGSLLSLLNFCYVWTYQLPADCQLHCMALKLDHVFPVSIFPLFGFLFHFHWISPLICSEEACLEG